jgi:Sugar phosphate permease
MSKGLIITVGVLIAFIVDGIDMQLLALSLPVIAKDFHLSSVQSGSLGTWTLFGMALGGTLASWLSDRWGRVRMLITGLILFSVCTSLLGFTQNYAQFAIIRTISGFGISAVWMCGTMVVAEYIPTKRRNLMLGILQAGWSIGYIIAALISAWILPVHGWRTMFIWAILPSIIALLLLIRAEDAPSWKASRHNKIKEGSNKLNEWAMIWADKKVSKNFIIWAIGSAALQFGFTGIINWLPSYLVQDLNVNLQSMGWYLAATYFMAILGKIAVGYLSDLIGRRKTWIMAGMLTAAAIPIIMNVSTASNVAYLLLIFGFLYGAPYALIATYMSESFPTNIRGTAYGISYNIGRIIAISAPLFIGFVASTYSIGAGLAILGIAYLICAVAPGLFVPEKMYDPTH